MRGLSGSGHERARLRLTMCAARNGALSWGGTHAASMDSAGVTASTAIRSPVGGYRLRGIRPTHPGASGAAERVDDPARLLQAIGIVDRTDEPDFADGAVAEGVPGHGDLDIADLGIFRRARREEAR